MHTLTITTVHLMFGLRKLYITLNSFWLEGATFSYSFDVFLKFPKQVTRHADFLYSNLLQIPMKLLSQINVTMCLFDKWVVKGWLKLFKQFQNLKLVLTFFFHQMIALRKLWKILFISSKKLFWFSRYSNFCNFSLPFHTFQIQKDKWKWNNLWCHELPCIN